MKFPNFYSLGKRTKKRLKDFLDIESEEALLRNADVLHPKKFLMAKNVGPKSLGEIVEFLSERGNCPDALREFCDSEKFFPKERQSQKVARTDEKAMIALDMRKQGKTLKEIGFALGLTSVRAGQLVKRAKEI